jgi:hypothetical protein
VLLAVGALHFAAIFKPFFADDFFFLEQVRGRQFAEALGSPDPIGNFLRPVSRPVWFWTLSTIGGQRPALFHAANLLLFLASLVVLYRLVRRLGGRTPALLAMTLVGFHHAADVPLRWASGSQELLALFFGALAVHLQVSRRHVLAAVALALGLLSKEAIAGAAIVALIASHDSGERISATLRRGAGLIAVTIGWAVLWVVTLPHRAGAGPSLSFDPTNAFAALAHLVQVALGLELRVGGDAFGHWGLPPVAFALAVAAIVWLAARARGGPACVPPSRASSSRALIRTGLAWTLTGLAPLVLVMPIWSAYFYLWSLFGVALLAAPAIARLPLAPRAATAALLVLLSGEARRLDEFAASGASWAWQSHVNRHYVDRSLATIERCLAQMKAARPTLPRHSTVFFANVPVSSGWQAGDGPLLRWAYGDSTLRSYFMTQFTRAKAARGQVFFFAVEDGALLDRTDDPLILSSFAYSMLIAERPAPAIEALDLAIERGETRASSASLSPAHAAAASGLRYWRAWARWANGDTLGAKADLAAIGVSEERRLSADELRAPAPTDTAAAIEHLGRLVKRAGLEPRLHARLATMSLASNGPLQRGVIEAFAYRTLAPDDPRAWRLWAAAQLAENQSGPALASLERYAALEGAHPDAEAERVIRSLRRVVRGDVAHQALRMERGSDRAAEATSGAR